MSYGIAAGAKFLTLCLLCELWDCIQLENRIEIPPLTQYWCSKVHFSHQQLLFLILDPSPDTQRSLSMQSPLISQQICFQQHWNSFCKIWASFVWALSLCSTERVLKLHKLCSSSAGFCLGAITFVFLTAPSGWAFQVLSPWYQLTYTPDYSAAKE